METKKYKLKQTETNMIWVYMYSDDDTVPIFVLKNQYDCIEIHEPVCANPYFFGECTLIDSIKHQNITYDLIPSVESYIDREYSVQFDFDDGFLETVERKFYARN